MGAQRAAWQHAFTCEAAALHKDECASGLLDLVEAFEAVPHAILVLLAFEEGYTACCFSDFPLRHIAANVPLA
jgi:hypothetical protein